MHFQAKLILQNALESGMGPMYLYSRVLIEFTMKTKQVSTYGFTVDLEPGTVLNIMQEINTIFSVNLLNIDHINMEGSNGLLFYFINNYLIWKENCLRTYNLT